MKRPAAKPAPDLPGPYDREEPDEDLWFLPQPDEPADDYAPGPRADKTPLFDPRDWREAEAGVAAELAALNYDFGRLAERLQGMGAGARQRLALQEVTGLGWWTGDRLSEDRLALWLTLRLGSTGDDAQALSRAAWAVRRLTAPPNPQGNWAQWLALQLGVADDVGVSDRVADAAEAITVLEGMHPISRSCALFHIWRMLTDSPARDIEAAVLAMRMAGGADAGGAGFLPLSLTGFSALTTSGAADRRLTGWVSGAHQAVLAALLHLDRLRAWQARATAQTTDLQGRTPPRLIALAASWPMITAPMAEAETGASRAAVQRNLDTLEKRALIREVTGQGRYRVWKAAI